MPTTYTHYKFGKDVLDILPASKQKIISANRKLYDIGLHGPDILFYYKALSSNPVSAQGYAMHDRCGGDFFERARAVMAGMKEKEQALAYLYGFICHFTLDSQCHNYIEKMIQVSKISHSKIEMELDRLLLVEDGVDPVHHLSIGHIVPSQENAAVIGPFFQELDRDTIQKALGSMITCHKLLHAPHLWKRMLLAGVLKAAGKYDSIYGMVMSRKPDPQCAQYCLFLEKLYREAVPLAGELIEGYQKFLEEGAPLPKRFERTFGAGDDWQELTLPKEGGVR